MQICINFTKPYGPGSSSSRSLNLSTEIGKSIKKMSARILKCLPCVDRSSHMYRYSFNFLLIGMKRSIPEVVKAS